MSADMTPAGDANMSIRLIRLRRTPKSWIGGGTYSTFTVRGAIGFVAKCSPQNPTRHNSHLRKDRKQAESQNMAGTYDPLKSEKTNAGAIATFKDSDVDEDLNSVPGIGPAGIAALEKVGVTSTVALIGKFLSLHEKGMTPLAHCVSDSRKAVPSLPHCSPRFLPGRYIVWNHPIAEVPWFAPFLLHYTHIFDVYVYYTTIILQWHLSILQWIPTFALTVPLLLFAPQEAFGEWLTDLDMHRSRNTIVRAIAEKCNIFMKGLADHAAILKEFEDRG